MINWIFQLKKFEEKFKKIGKLTTIYNKTWWKSFNWINLKVRGLKWMKEKLEELKLILVEHRGWVLHFSLIIFFGMINAVMHSNWMHFTKCIMTKCIFLKTCV